MHTRTSSTLSTTSVNSSLGSVSRTTLFKAVGLLILIWTVSTFYKFPEKNGNTNDIQVISPAQGSKGSGDVVPPVTGTEGSTGINVDGSNKDLDKIPSESTPQSQSSPPTTTTTTTDTKVKQYTDRVAVIIENRPLANLVPVVLHFHTVLGPEWPIIFYTTPSTAASLTASSRPFRRAVDEGRVAIRHLPDAARLDSHRAVSLFLTEPWLWRDLAPFDKVLMFQDDSILCSRAPGSVDDFLQYDLIGAPVAAQYGRGYNGGLSLRSRQVVLDIVERYSWANDSVAPGAPTHHKFEDQWLYTRMGELGASDGEGKGGESLSSSPSSRKAVLPSVEVASKFSVETIWAEAPLGFHQPARWQEARMGEIMEYCPEVGMISSAAFFS